MKMTIMLDQLSLDPSRRSVVASMSVVADHHGRVLGSGLLIMLIEMVR